MKSSEKKFNQTSLDLLVKRIAISLQYEGSSFSGWQRQKQGIATVQEELENAICSLDPLRPIKAVAAGRTDAGVHAAAQVVHFDFAGPIPVNRWAKALNGRLPKTIRVREAVLRPSNWHACHSAIYRRYRYTIYKGCLPNLFLSDWTWHKYQVSLDLELMRRALKGLIGFHDFKAFQRSGSKRAHSYTTIQDVKLEIEGDLLIFEIQASGFLYGMVRLLLGQLVALGEHRMTFLEFENIWKNGRRDLVKEAAPSKGLCLIGVGYEEQIFSAQALQGYGPKYLLAN